MAKKKSQEFIDVRSLVESYIKHWYLFVVAILAFGFLGYVYIQRTPRNMAVRANILISQDNDNPFGGSGASGAMGAMSSLFGSDAYVEDEVFIISSHSLYRDVAKNLNLNKIHYVKEGFMKTRMAYPDFPVDVVAPGVADTLTTSLMFKVKVDAKGSADVKVLCRGKKLAEAEDVTLPYVFDTPFGEYTVAPTATFPKGKAVNTAITFSGYESAAEMLTDDVEADIASKRSNVIMLEYDTPNAAYGSAVLNEILALYNARGIADKNLQSEKTAQFLDDRLRILASDLNTAETDIQNYKQSHGIVDIEAEATYQATKKGGLEQALLEEETAYEVIRLTHDFLVDSVKAFQMVPVVVENKSIADGIAAYNDLVLRRQELLSTAKPDNFMVKQLDSQISISRANILSAVNNAMRQAAARVADVRGKIAQTDSRLNQIPSQEREYIDMKRQQVLKQELYLFLLQRQEENAILLANSIAKGKVIDEAFTLSTPLGMSPMMVMIIFLFFGFIATPIYLYLRKLIRDRVETRKEAEQHLSAPILGEMCVDRSGRNLVVAEHDTSSATELFRLMRSNLLFLLSDPSDKVVLLTSTKSGEGKSFISCNLAASLSLLENKRVLLVGMDIRNPQVGNYLGIDSPLGVTNYLSSAQVSLDSIIVKMPGYKTLDVMLAGPIPPNPAELLTSKKLDEMFAILRERYDYIIVDSAPVGMVSDTFAISRISDATIFVTRINHTTLTDLRFVEEIYDEKRLKKMSVVINGTHTSKGYGYGYNARQANAKKR